jgi:hypothetical protein
MGGDIDAIGQTTDYNQTVDRCGQISDEMFDKIEPVGCGMACADYSYGVETVEVARPDRIEHGRSVVTVRKASRVAVVTDKSRGDGF